MNSEQAIEQEIQAKGLNAPRLTPDHIDSVIAGEYWFTADKAVGENVPVLESMKVYTICLIVLRNGFIVEGHSAPVSAENFDAGLGIQIARENARKKIWELEGYLLKEKLNRREIAKNVERDEYGAPIDGNDNQG